MQLKLADSILEIDLVVFDCDGVLLDSMSAKIKAFESWVPAAYAEYKPAFMQMIMHGFGTSRERHIESFYRKIVGTEPEPGFLQKEVERFTEICEPLCARAGWRAGSKAFVMRCVEAGVRRYVLSGTPQKQLEAMLQANGGRAFFDQILGSPPAKPEGMEHILVETGVGAERTVFIGDADADRLAAAHVRAHFVYFPSQAARPAGKVATEVRDLRELLV